MTSNGRHPRSMTQAPAPGKRRLHSHHHSHGAELAWPPAGCLRLGALLARYPDLGGWIPTGRSHAGDRRAMHGHAGMPRALRAASAAEA